MSLNDSLSEVTFKLLLYSHDIKGSHKERLLRSPQVQFLRSREASWLCGTTQCLTNTQRFEEEENKYKYKVTLQGDADIPN